MAYRLTSLPKTQFSGLDFDNILEDIINLIKENPEYNEDWDDFLSSNAGRMMVELFSYITDQLATRIDWIVNENYIGTAKQKRSVMRMLKLIGYKFKLPIAATVDVSISFDKVVGDFILTEAFNPNDTTTLFYPYSLTAKDKSGNDKTFECINYNTDTNKFDYLSPIVLNTGTQIEQNLYHNINFFEGITYIENFVADTDNNPIFELSKTSVIEGSVSVFIVQDNVASQVVEALLVDSFLDPDAQSVVDDYGNPINIPYIINVLDENGVSIEFAPTSLLPNIDRRLEEGSRVRVIYRVGGGKDGNITKQAINTTKKISVINGTDTIITNVLFKNEEEGTGGEDSETIEHAAAYAPLSIRTVDKAVTENDYDILLNGKNSILKAKTYGNNNMPDDIYDKYGIYIKPLEVWNYILKLKAGWEDIAPSDYKYFQWIELRKENRFNELHFFKKGNFGIENNLNLTSMLEEESINIDGVSNKNFYNLYYIDTDDDFKNGFTDPALRVKLTNTKNTTNYFYDLAKYNIFDENNLDNQGEINTVSKSIYFPVNSEIVGSQNLKTEMVLNQVFDPAIDGYSLTNTLTLNGSELTATDIATQINNAFFADPNICNNITPQKGEQSIILSNTPSGTDTTTLQEKTTYYFYINEKEYSIKIDKTIPTYNELVDMINEELKIITTTASKVFGSYEITNINEIDKLEIGYKYTINTDTYSSSSEEILDVFEGEHRIRVATIGDHSEDITISFYKYLCEYDETSGTLKITNNKKTPYESLIIRKGTTNDLFSNFDTGNETISSPLYGGNVIGSQNLGLNVTLTDDPNIVDGTYSFILNNYIYSITVAGDVSTYDDIITKMNEVLAPNFTAVEDTNDIKITSNNYNYIEMRDGLLPTDLVYALHKEVYSFTNDNSKGGGDYSNIISIYYGENREEYLRIKSPSKGITSSNIKLQAASANLFGNERTNIEFRGINRLSLITNSTSEDVGKFIFEKGNIDSPSLQYTTYLNYIIYSNDVLEIGKYFYDNFPVNDVRHRDIADRLYNTVYKDDGSIDFIKSNFELRFTKEPTDKNSIFAISSDWDLEQSAPAYVDTLKVSDFTSMANNYNIKLSIDSGLPVEIDITGDNGTTEFPTYTTIVGLINNALNSVYLTSNVIYATYSSTYDKITITSPSYKNDSRIQIFPATANDATNIVFGLDIGETYTYYPSGDYYIEYNAEIVEDGKLTGQVEGRNYLKLLPITTSNKIPDLDFYVSFIFDQTIIDGIYDGETEELSTDGTTLTVVGKKFGDVDEDEYSSYLTLKKIVGINNVFKESYFSTFDISGNIYYNKLFSQAAIQESVEAKLNDEYGLLNRDYAQIVSRSKIMKLLHEVPGIEYVEIDYFGRDNMDKNNYPSQNNVIDCAFNEIIVLSEKRYSYGTLIHGVMFNYKVIN